MSAKCGYGIPAPTKYVLLVQKSAKNIFLLVLPLLTI
jgi:hypothetical protein